MEDLFLKEFPTSEEKLNPPDEFAWEYVSAQYLSGFVNYTEHVRVVGLIRYMREERSDDEASAELNKTLGEVHFNAGAYNDDIILLRSSENHWWGFYYDMDCSDCCIVKLRKDRHTIEDVLGLILPANDHGRPVENKLRPQGWITFR